MRFTVATYGSEGDTRPLVALCKGLMSAGHEVRLFADRSTLASAQEHGVEALALAGDMKATVGPDGPLAKLMSEGGDVTEVARAATRIANDNAGAWMKAIVEDARASDAVLFSGMASYIGLSAGEHLGIPAIGLGLWPISPTREFPSSLLRPWRLPGWLNRLSHRAVNALLWSMLRKKLNEARRDVCAQPPRRRRWQKYPVLYGISPQLVPKPSDWPGFWEICGAWHTAAGTWSPPKDLADFLDDGDPPIYVGFGSMAGFDKDRLLSALADGLQGRRVLFYPGWSGIESDALPDNFFSLGHTPHDWLFAKVSMVIHHGGAGTTHTAVRAGVPSVVIPFAADQFFWADRLEKAGVAPRYVPHTRLSASLLSDMVAFAEKEEVRANAIRLGAAMNKEDGVACAIAHIERFARRLS